MANNGSETKSKRAKKMTARGRICLAFVQVRIRKTSPYLTWELASLEVVSMRVL